MLQSQLKPLTSYQQEILGGGGGLLVVGAPVYRTFTRRGKGSMRQDARKCRQGEGSFIICGRPQHGSYSSNFE